MNFGTSKLPIIIEAMLYIAHGDATPLGGKKMAEIMRLNPRYLEPCLQNMVKAGLLHSAKGAKGGYSLAVKASELTIAQICEIATGSEGKPQHKQPELQQNIIAPIFKMAEKCYMATLESASLQSLLDAVRAKKLDNLLDIALGDTNETLNYAI